MVSDPKGHTYLDPNEGSIGSIHLLTDHGNLDVYLARRLRRDDLSRSLFIA